MSCTLVYFLEADTDQGREVEKGAKEVVVLGLVTVKISIALQSHKIFLVVIDSSHAGTYVQRPGAGAILVLRCKQMPIAHIGRYREVEQPLRPQHPVVPIAGHDAIVIIEEVRHILARWYLFLSNLW